MVQRQLRTEGLFAFRGFRASPHIVQGDGAASDHAGLREALVLGLVQTAGSCAGSVQCGETLQFAGAAIPKGPAGIATDLAGLIYGTAANCDLLGTQNHRKVGLYYGGTFS